MLRDWQETVLKNVEKAIDSGMVPDSFFEDNYLLAKAVIDGSMRDRPFAKANQKLYQEEYDSIRLSF